MKLQTPGRGSGRTGRDGPGAPPTAPDVPGRPAVSQGTRTSRRTAGGVRGRPGDSRPCDGPCFIPTPTLTLLHRPGPPRSPETEPRDSRDSRVSSRSAYGPGRGTSSACRVYPAAGTSPRPGPPGPRPDTPPPTLEPRRRRPFPAGRRGPPSSRGGHGQACTTRPSVEREGRGASADPTRLAPVQRSSTPTFGVAGGAHRHPGPSSRLGRPVSVGGLPSSLPSPVSSVSA